MTAHRLYPSDLLVISLGKHCGVSLVNLIEIGRGFLVEVPVVTENTRGKYVKLHIMHIEVLTYQKFLNVFFS